MEVQHGSCNFLRNSELGSGRDVSDRGRRGARHAVALKESEERGEISVLFLDCNFNHGLVFSLVSLCNDGRAQGDIELFQRAEIWEVECLQRAYMSLHEWQ